MGFWRTERGIGGDSWADKLDGAIKNLAKDVVAGTKTYGDKPHVITMEEFADLVEFCSRGHLVVDVREPEDAKRPLSKLRNASVKTYSNRGQIHC